MQSLEPKSRTLLHNSQILLREKWHLSAIEDTYICTRRSALSFSHLEDLHDLHSKHQTDISPVLYTMYGVLHTVLETGSKCQMDNALAQSFGSDNFSFVRTYFGDEYVHMCHSRGVCINKE